MKFIPLKMTKLLKKFIFYFSAILNLFSLIQSQNPTTAPAGFSIPNAFTAPGVITPPNASGPIPIPSPNPLPLGPTTTARPIPNPLPPAPGTTARPNPIPSATTPKTNGTGRQIRLRNNVYLNLPLSIGVVVGIRCQQIDPECRYPNGIGFGAHDLAALPLALEDIKLNPNWTLFHDVVANIYDTNSSELSSIEAMTAASTNLAIIGPQDNCIHEPGIAAIDNRFVLSYRCQGRDNRGGLGTFSSTDYSTFAQMSWSYGETIRVMVEWIKPYKWDRVVIIHFTDYTDTALAQLDQLTKALQIANIIILKIYDIDDRFAENSVPFANLARPKFLQILVDTAWNTRVYFVMGKAPGAVGTFFMTDLMARMGLLQTDEYVIVSSVGTANDFIYDGSPDKSDIWTLYPLSPLHPYDSPILRRPTPEETFQNYRSIALFIDSPPIADYPKWIDFQKRVQNIWNNPPCPLLCKYPMQPYPEPYPIGYVPLEMGFMYDGILSYVEAAVEMINSNVTDPNKGDVMVQQFGERIIHSVTGLDVFIDSFGLPTGNITILTAWLPNQTSKIGIYPVGQYWLNETDDGVSSYIHYFNKQYPMNWLGGVIPRPYPTCGFKGTSCVTWKDYNMEIIVGGFSVMLVIGFLAAIMVFRQWRYERQLQSLFWKVHTNDLVLQDLNEQMASMRSMGSATMGSMGQSTTTLKMQKSHISLRDYDKTLKHDVKKKPDTDTATTSETKPVQKKQNIYNQVQKAQADDDDELGHKRKKPVTDAQQKKLWADVDSFAIAQYKGRLVGLKRIYKHHINFSRAVRRELKQMIDIRHEHLNPLEGMVHEPPNVFLVTEFRQRGCLKDILENEEIQIDGMFLSSMIYDMIKGLTFLHHGILKCHGRLKSTNCFLDARWVLRLSGFGVVALREAEQRELSEEEKCRKLLWTAPELLRDAVARLRGTPKGDIYAFGIILHEMFARKGVFGDELLSPIDVVHQVTHPKAGQPPFRPDMTVLEGTGVPGFVELTMQQCWDESPDARPLIESVKRKLHPLQKGLKSSVMENMMMMMEKHSTNLETIVAERTIELQEEKKKTERLLLQMLPKTVAEALKRGQTIDPERFESVTIYFSDIAGFTAMSSQSTPEEVVAFLNDLYTCFDGIINNYDVYKVETIGDAYMVVSGLPTRNGDNHAGEIASMSLSLLDAVNHFKIRHRPTDILKLRIGIHSGYCVAGVVGLKMPRYCLFGDTVFTANKMESSGQPLKIHCSSETRNILQRLGGFELADRGMTEVKPNEPQEFTYWVVGEDLDIRNNRIEVECVKYPTLKKKRL